MKTRAIPLYASLLLAAAALLAQGCGLWRPPLARESLRPALAPPWALECWLWEDDVNTAAEVDRLLEGYKRHDIPVRTVLIDSPWSTRYNDFNVDPERYPADYFQQLEDRGYRVVLWMTSMVNSENSDTGIRDAQSWYEPARNAGYLAAGGYQAPWWKGRGGFIDYSDPEARAWWRGMQQAVLDQGIDGWKLDGTATMFMRRALGVIPLFWLPTHDGLTSTRRYMDLYYRGEYEHGLSQNPEFITLSRSIDSFLLHPWGWAPKDAAPVTWVGDQRHNWSAGGEGLEEALRYVLRASNLGYPVVGSDIGGFGGERPIPPRLYIRWAQFSTFCGLFLNGGQGNRALWERTPEELEIIRRYAWLHTELVPYIFSLAAQCHEGGPAPIRPLGRDYHYYFGDHLLVAPIYRDTKERTVSLPEGRWRYLFDPARIVEGPAEVTWTFPLSEYPVFVRQGALVPMRVSRGYTGFGGEDTATFTTLLVHPGRDAVFKLRQPDSGGVTRIELESTPDGFELRVEGAPLAHRLLIWLDAPPQAAYRNGARLKDWTYEPDRTALKIRAPEAAPARYRIVYGP